MKVVLTERDYCALKLAAEYGAVTPAQVVRALTPITEWAPRYIEERDLQTVYRPEDNVRARMSKMSKAEEFPPLAMTRLPDRRLIYSLTTDGEDLIGEGARRDQRAALNTQDGDLVQQLAAVGIGARIAFKGALVTPYGGLLRIDSARTSAHIKSLTKSLVREHGAASNIAYATCKAATAAAVKDAYPDALILKTVPTAAGYYYSKALDPRRPSAVALAALRGEEV